MSRPANKNLGEPVDEDDAVAPRPRLEDVAARVGLSPATVSLALSNAPGPSAQTRRRVLPAAGELGYRPDRTAVSSPGGAAIFSACSWRCATASTPSSSRTSRPPPNTRATSWY